MIYIGDFGIGVGNIIGACLSYHKNKSILLAIVHGLLGWLYVIWYLFNN